MRDKLKKYIKIGIVALFFLAIIGYASWRARDLIRGISLEINGITDDETYTRSDLDITGIAKKVKSLAINGREIFLDKDWRFSEKILLLPGYNVITLATEDNFGKKEEKVFRAVYK